VRSPIFPNGCLLAPVNTALRALGAPSDRSVLDVEIFLPATARIFNALRISGRNSAGQEIALTPRCSSCRRSPRTGDLR